MNINRIETWVKNVSSRTWFSYLLLILITGLAAGLRFYKLGEWSLWIDEIYTINHAQRHFGTWELLLQNIPPHRNWIPISVILTAQTLNLLGVSEWSARLVSALIGTLTIPILFFPLRKLFGNRITLIALLLLTVSPWHIFWSQNARFYTTLMLFYTLSLFVFYIGIENDKPVLFLIFFILVYLASSERLIAVLIFPVIYSYLAVIWISKLERPKGFIAKNILIISSPLILGGVIEGFSRIINGESRFFGDFNWFTQYQIDDPMRILIFFSNNIGIPLVVMTIFSGILMSKRKFRSGILMFLGAVTPLILLMISNLFIFTKDRYLFITLVSWITLPTISFVELMKNSRKTQWLVIGLLFVFITQASNDLILYYKINNGNRLEWKNAFLYVLERADDDDMIVSFWPEFSPFYLDREIVSYESLNPISILAENKDYWFVLDSETIWTNAELKLWVEINATLMDMRFLRIPEESFLKIYHFIPGSRPVP